LTKLIKYQIIQANFNSLEISQDLLDTLNISKFQVKTILHFMINQFLSHKKMLNLALNSELLLIVQQSQNWLVKLINFHY
jgi:hypothetical protein